MSVWATLGIKVDSSDVPKAEKRLKGLAKQGGRTEKATDSLGNSFKRLAGPLAAYLGTRQIIASADAWTGLGNRLRVVTDNSQDLIEAQDAVFQIAQEARQPLDATAELYQRIATNQDALGISSERVAGVVETVSKAVAISGSSAQAAAAAMVQLGQGFGAGELRGQELNSILEQTPALAKAIADGLGKEVGELKKLGESGSLTAEKIIGALESQGEAVDTSFGKINATVAQSVTVFGNSITKVIGGINETVGASDGLSSSILGISAYLDSGAFTSGILETMAIWRGTIDATTDTTADLGDELELLSTIGGDSVDFIVNAFKEMPANIAAITKVIVVEFVSAFDKLQNHGRLFADTIKAIFTDDTIDGAYKRFQEAEAGLNDARQSTIQTIFDQREAVLQLGAAQAKLQEDEQKAREKERAEREAAIAEQRKNAKGGLGGAGGDDKEAIKAAERLQKAYLTTAEGLKEQIALFDQVGEAATLRYAVEEGALSGLTESQKQNLLLMAEQLDAMEAQKTFAEEVQQIIEDSVPEAQKQIEEYKGQILTLKIAMSEGSVTADQYAESVGHINEKIAQTVKDSDKFGQEVEKLGADIDTALLDGISGAIGGVEGWEKQFLASIAKIMIQLVAMKAAQAFGTTGTVGGDAGTLGVGSSILGGLFGDTGGGGAAAAAGGGGSFLGNIGGFLGFKDGGGFVGAGQFAVAGEKRPEIITGPANIIGGADTAKMMSGKTNNNNVTVNISGNQDDRSAKRAGGMAGAAAVKAMNRMQRYT